MAKGLEVNKSKINIVILMQDLQSQFSSVNYTVFINNTIKSSKTNPCSDSKRQKVNVENNKTMSTILSFIRILHLKPKSSILRHFYRLTFEKVYIEISFLVIYFAVRG